MGKKVGVPTKKRGWQWQEPKTNPQYRRDAHGITSDRQNNPSTQLLQSLNPKNQSWSGTSHSSAQMDVSLGCDWSFKRAGKGQVSTLQNIQCPGRFGSHEHQHWNPTGIHCSLKWTLYYVMTRKTKKWKISVLARAFLCLNSSISFFKDDILTKTRKTCQTNENPTQKPCDFYFCPQ